MTIEQIRQLPKDNWLGITRIGEHAWQVGDPSSGGNTLCLVTGDGGVVDYVKTLLEEMRKPIPTGKGLIEQINEGSKLNYSKLTYGDLVKIVEEAMFPKDNGVGKD